MSKLFDLLNTLIGKVNASVKTEAQNLTEEQKAQARANIGVSEGGGSSAPADAVLYSAQTLTDAQKTQARTNIGAGTSDLTLDASLSDSAKAAPASAAGDAQDMAAQSMHAAITAGEGALVVPYMEAYMKLMSGEAVMEQFIHASDKVPTMADLEKGYAIAMYQPGGDVVFSGANGVVFEVLPRIANEELFASAVIDMGGIITLTIMGGFAPVVVIVPTDNLAVEGTVFPKKGVYVMPGIGAFRINGYSFSDGGDVGDLLVESGGGGALGSAVANGDTITWDGNTEDLEIIQEIYFKVSEVGLPYAALASGFSVTAIVDGVATDVTEFEVVDYEAGLGIPGFIITSNSRPLVLSLVHPVNEGDVLTPAGLYFVRSSVGDVDTFTSRFTIPGYNFGTSSGGGKVLNSKYLPEHLQFGEVEVNDAFGSAKANGDTITWDGNTTGMETVEYTGTNVSASFALVSERTPALELLTSEATVADNYGASTGGWKHEDGLSHCDRDFVFVIYTPGASTQYGVFPKAGVYMASANVDGRIGYPSSLTIPGFDFGTTTKEIKPIDPKYLPSGIGGDANILYRGDINTNPYLYKTADINDENNRVTASELRSMELSGAKLLVCFKDDDAEQYAHPLSVLLGDGNGAVFLYNGPGVPPILCHTAEYTPSTTEVTT